MRLGREQMFPSSGIAASARRPSTPPAYARSASPTPSGCTMVAARTQSATARLPASSPPHADHRDLAALGPQERAEGQGHVVVLRAGRPDPCRSTEAALVEHGGGGVPTRPSAEAHSAPSRHRAHAARCGPVRLPSDGTRRRLAARALGAKMKRGLAFLVAVALLEAPLARGQGRRPVVPRRLAEGRAARRLRPPPAASAADLVKLDDFDVEALAAQLESAGARYLVLTLGQNSGFFNAPNAAYDRRTGYRSRRALLAPRPAPRPPPRPRCRRASA